MAIESINTTLLSRNRLPVYVIRVESPTLFWVQLKYNRSNVVELQEDIKHLIERKGKRYALLPHGIYLERLVAVQKDGEWYRGRITAIQGQKITVYLGDWGRHIKKSIWELYDLPIQFHSMAWQAIACGLHGIKPLNSTAIWGHKSKAFMKVLVEGEEGWIKIKEPVGTQAADVSFELTIRGVLGAISVKKELLHLGQAEVTIYKYRPFPSV